MPHPSPAQPSDTQQKRKYPIIDAHTHPFGNRGLDLSNDIKSVRDPILLRRRNPALFQEMLKGTDDLSEEMLGEMDRAGIDRAVIQSRGIGTNEAVAQAVRRHPDRFTGLFRPIYNTRISGQQDALDYAELGRSMDYWVGELGLKGMGEIRVSRFSAESAPEKIARDLVPLLEILARHRMPIMFQTAWTQFGTPIYHGVPTFVDDLAERFPEVPFIITKMGRGYDALFEMCLLIAFKHDNVYLDTVQSKPAHVARAVAEVGPERVIFGTDWEPDLGRAQDPGGYLHPVARHRGRLGHHGRAKEVGAGQDRCDLVRHLTAHHNCRRQPRIGSARAGWPLRKRIPGTRRPPVPQGRR